jgi:hypothetical protein
MRGEEEVRLECEDRSRGRRLSGTAERKEKHLEGILEWNVSLSFSFSFSFPCLIFFF